MHFKILTIISFVLLLSSVSCTAAKKSTANAAEDSLPIAFPGAEGFGKYTTGGRGGKVFIVSNLNERGPGSFREAAESKLKRIIVFAISGTIHLETKLSIKADVTIAGQSAPGDGICVADQSVLLGGNNIIVRFMRFRMGDKYQKAGMIDGNGGDDAFGGTHRNNIIIDHCSMSWSTDEVFSVYAGDSTTLQWNIISEPLNYSYHFETGDKDYEHHGYGAIWGGQHLSAHHNLFAHCANRTPRFDGTRNAPQENVDLVNNVIYNWVSNNSYAGEGGNYNIINNYYKYGPDTKKQVLTRIANPYKKAPSIPFGKFYINGNYSDGSPEVSKNNWLGVEMNEGTNDDAKAAKLANPFSTFPVAIQSAGNAYNLVLNFAGAIFPKRDTLDARIIQNVKNRTGNIIDVQGGFPHGTAYEKTISAWPTLANGNAVPDTDKDGMPDDWEKKNGLNSNDSSDASVKSPHSFYCNLEVYLNSLIK
ncbi:MAG: pectate lyase [Ferruginibacter sp.]